jgi:signal transduction histidine kinase
MFTFARLKLTAWYLLIIMSVSLAFSFVVYRMLNQEVDRFVSAQRIRLERRWLPPTAPFSIVLLDPDLVIEIRHRIIVMLALVNLGILVISGITGYFLAGVTLAPIQAMVSEQNRFISDSSHELRTPLTSLRAAMEVFLRDKNPKISEAKVLISESLEDVQKLQSLSESLMQLAAFQKPTDQTKRTIVNLSDLIIESVKKVTPIAVQKQIVISQSVADFKIKGDKYSLTDLLVILLDNAIKYSPNQSRVEIMAKKSDGSVKIDVSDHGIGISKSDLPHVFDRFYRADTARSANTATGFGLGLAIAKKIVDSHHGSISVKSVINSGSVFTVKLPLVHTKLPSAPFQKQNIKAKT